MYLLRFFKMLYELCVASLASPLITPGLNQCTRCSESRSPSECLGRIKQTLELISQGAREALGCDVVTLYSYDKERDDFGIPPIMVGVDASEPDYSSHVEGRSIIRRIITLDSAYVAEDVTSTC